MPHKISRALNRHGFIERSLPANAPYQHRRVLLRRCGRTVVAEYEFSTDLMAGRKGHRSSFSSPGIQTRIEGGVAREWSIEQYRQMLRMHPEAL